MTQTGTVTVNSSILAGIPAQNHRNLKERIYSRIRPDLVRIEAEIERNLSSSVPFISTVGRHIMAAVESVTAAANDSFRKALRLSRKPRCRLAVVFEFLHASSLLHDDVVDNAEFRRSQPAANVLWGNQGWYWSETSFIPSPS